MLGGLAWKDVIFEGREGEGWEEGRERKRTLQDLCLTRSFVYSFILFFMILSG